MSRVPINEPPSKWKKVKLEKICKLRKGNCIPNKEGKLKYIGLEHIDSGDPTINRFGSEKDVRASQHLFYKNDILYGKLRPYLDKAIVPDFEGICSTDILVLEPIKDEILSRYLINILHMKRFLRYIKSTMSGTTLPRTNWKDLSRFIINLPNLNEQENILSILNNIQNIISYTQNSIEKLQILKKGVMQRLFTKGIEHKKYKKTQLGRIPEHWEVYKLEDVIIVKSGKRLPKGTPYSEISTPYPYIRIVDFKNGTINTKNLKYLTPEIKRIINKYIINKDDVYLSVAGTIGLVGVVPHELDGANLTENAVRLVIEKKNLLTRDFLYYYLASYIGQKEIKRRTTITSQPKLATKRIKLIPIIIPLIQEQKVFVQILKNFDEKIFNELNYSTKLKRIKNGLMQDLLTGKKRVFIKNIN